MKLKTHKGLSKRIKITKSGKLLKRRAFRSHLLTKKSNKRKRKFAKTFTVNSSDSPKIRKLLPYLKKNKKTSK
uniref:Large ribosomal subunit protein bL35 n=1 Tax=candidate division CPR3 bacterium TaxID=2268181 RepID=A0A7C4LZS0_UNCC3